MNRFPTTDEIEAELDDIWPGWTLSVAADGKPHAQSEPRNMALKPAELPEPWMRRVKWLLKVYRCHVLGHITNGWGVQLIQAASMPGRWFCHPVPGRGYQAVDEPDRVSGPPPRQAAPQGAGATAAPVTAAAIAVQLRAPLGAVRAALETCPRRADRLEWVRDVLAAEVSDATS